MTLAAQIWSALGKVIDPEIRLPLTELDMLDEPILEADGSVTQRVKLTVVGCPASDKIERDVRAAIASVPGVKEVKIQLDVMSPTEREALVAKLRGNKPARVNPFDADTLSLIHI